MIDLDALEALSFRAAPVGWRLFDGQQTIEVSLSTGRLGEHPCVIAWAGVDSCGLPVRTSKANAALIVAARNALPELIRLARIGQKVEATASQPDTKAQPVAWRYRYKNGGKWMVAESYDCCNTLPEFEIQPLYAHPDSQPEGTTLRKLHDRLGSMIEQIGHPDYSLRELVEGLREVRDALYAVSQPEGVVVPLPEPCGWRREWEGDASDLGQWVEAWSREELDERGPWEALYTETQVRALLAAAKEESSQQLRADGLRISACSVDAVDREERDAQG